MKDRLLKLKLLLEELKSECYGDMYGICDFVEEDSKDMAKLIEERDFYENALKNLDKLVPDLFVKEELPDDGKPF